MTHRKSEPLGSGWQPLSGDWRPSPDVLRETLDGGQAFRWRDEVTPSALRSLGEAGSVSTEQSAIAVWTGIWGDNLVQLRLHHDTLQWRAPAGTATTGPALRRYLGADTDWAALADALPWRSDPHLRRCLEAFPGLHILRQPFGETLLGFLCSATKQIVQIKQMLGLLAERHGSALGWNAASGRVESASRTPRSQAPASRDKPAPTVFRRLPAWPDLAALSERDLRACQLGFRARFIHGTARFLAQNPGWLEETEHLPYAAAKARLLTLPGVGEKIADCVLLFGAGRLEAFPVDTWILKSLARRYGLDGWKPAQVARFGRAHFGPLAGLAQQYLFAWERRLGER